MFSILVMQEHGPTYHCPSSPSLRIVTCRTASLQLFPSSATCVSITNPLSLYHVSLSINELLHSISIILRRRHCPHDVYPSPSCFPRTHSSNQPAYTAARSPRPDSTPSTSAPDGKSSTIGSQRKHQVELAPKIILACLMSLS
jgi:hypothetical protein